NDRIEEAAVMALRRFVGNGLGPAPRRLAAYVTGRLPRFPEPMRSRRDQFSMPARVPQRRPFVRLALMSNARLATPSKPAAGPVDVDIEVILVSRFRSSQYLAAHSDANFGIKGTLASLCF